MKLSAYGWLCGLVLTCVASAVTAQPTSKNKANAARDAMLAQVPDVPGLPRVLLIGDSISMGYTVKVRELLAGKANVHRPPENSSDSANGLKKLDTWLGAGKWDVIHFNFGLHDLPSPLGWNSNPNAERKYFRRTTRGSRSSRRRLGMPS